jgi:hypothetical protein
MNKPTQSYNHEKIWFSVVDDIAPVPAFLEATQFFRPDEMRIAGEMGF